MHFCSSYEEIKKRKISFSLHVYILKRKSFATLIRMLVPFLGPKLIDKSHATCICGLILKVFESSKIEKMIYLHVLTEEFVFLSYLNAIKMSNVVALYLFGAFRMY